MKEAIVIKIGGSTFHQPSTLDIGDIEDIVELQQRGNSMVIVHGGGGLITQWLEKQQVTTRFVNGERVTDNPTLEVVVAVLAGLINKEIVALINNCGGKAVGICGVDSSLLEAKLKDKTLGNVGIITKVNTWILETLLNAGFIPVIAPLSIHSSAKSDNDPQILNVNGDTVAGEIAAALTAERLIFITDVDGIHDKQDNLIPRLSPAEVEALLSSGVASGGMIPKIKACLRALSGTCTASIIGGKTPHALLKEIEEGNVGTTIRQG